MTSPRLLGLTTAGLQARSNLLGIPRGVDDVDDFCWEFLKMCDEFDDWGDDFTNV